MKDEGFKVRICRQADKTSLEGKFPSAHGIISLVSLLLLQQK